MLVWRILLTAVVSLPAAAQWKALGPFGGPASIVQTDPNSPKTLLAGTSNALLFRSRDAGESWETLRFPRELRASLHALAIPPRLRDLYLAGVSPENSSDSGLWRSVDAGATWQPVAAFQGMPVWCIATFRGNPARMAAGTDTGVFQTSDGGLTWSRISPLENRQLQPVVSVAYDAKDPAVLYAGTPHLPWKTTDGGASWCPAHVGMLDDSDVFSIAVDRNRPQRLLSAACSGIYRTLNGGGKWAKASQSPEASHRTYTVAQDPQYENVFFAGTVYGMMRSRDGGATWTTISPYSTRSIAFDLGRLGRIFIATDQAGILRSDDNGDTWRPANQGFCNRRLVPLTEDGAGTVYTGAIADGAESTIFALPGGAAEWLTASVPASAIAAVAASVRTPGTLYAAAGGTVLVSSDAGKRWTAATAASGDAPNLLLAPSWQGEPVLAASGPSVFVSRDSGNAWSQRQFPSAVRSLVSLDAPWIAALTDSEIYVSKDGDGWERYGRAPHDSEIRGIAASGARFFVATATGLRVSDEARSLRLVSGVPAETTVQAICRYPSKDSVLFAASYNSIFTSTDAGRTWRRMAIEGWPAASVKQLLVPRGNPDRLLVLTPQQGVFEVALHPER
jgi:photosystem II stability/assembly factor-like uncharacterized protein